MTKQEFLVRYNVLAEFWEKTFKLGEALNELLMEGGIIILGEDLQSSYIDMLAEQSGIDSDSIGWLLYEGGGQAWADEDAEPQLIDTPEALWDFYKNDTK